MQVTFTPTNPAEARLLAAFMVDFSEHLELQACVPVAPAVEAEAPAKKSRSKKPVATLAESTATPTESADTSCDTEEPGNESADTAEPVEESGADEPVTTDALRALFGTLSQDGKRDAAVKVVRSYGFNSIKDITDDKIGEIHAKLKAL
jgi:dsRNA-specific ribonuclease